MRWLLAGLALAFLGCGGGGTTLPTTYPVTGSVTDAKGVPIKGGLVQFTSTTDTTLTVSSLIQEDGTFTLKTVKDRSEASGVPAGQYRVTIIPPFTSGQSGGEPIELPGTATVGEGPQRYDLRAGKAPKAG